MNQTKESVKLRKRLRPSGNTALFLEFYIKGKRTYEYLNLFLVPDGKGACV